MNQHRANFKLILSMFLMIIMIISSFVYFQSNKVANINNQQVTESLFTRLNVDSDRTFKVLFYGQSITEQSWWKRTANTIQAQYPNVKFEFVNKAIGAHTAEKLVRLVDEDVIPMHPDLVIFHVYGGHQFYEEIINKIKTHTNAEILIATDHIGAFDDINEETNPNNLSHRNIINKIHNMMHKDAPKASWVAWKNYVFFPHLSEKYGVVVIDVRSQWKAYLKTNHLKQRDLLIDNVHLNTMGNRVMASIYEDFFKNSQKNYQINYQHQKNKPHATSQNETLLLVSHGLKLQENQLIADCKGQRVQAILNKGALQLNENKLDIKILVDGQPPSNFQSAYGFTRASSYPNSNWPALLSITKGDAPLIAENWKAKIFPKDIALNDFDFEVYGSVTGFDGRGNSQTDFTSNSKKLKILAEDWNLAFAYSVFKQKLPENFEVNWKSEFRGNDQLNNPDIFEWTVVQDINGASHHIVFSGKGLQAIHEVRCFDK